MLLFLLLLLCKNTWRTEQNNILGISRIIFYWAIAFLHLLKGNKIPDRWWCMKWFSLGYYYHVQQPSDMVNKSCICSKLLRTLFGKLPTRYSRREKAGMAGCEIQTWPEDTYSFSPESQIQNGCVYYTCYLSRKRFFFTGHWLPKSSLRVSHNGPQQKRRR